MRTLLTFLFSLAILLPALPASAAGTANEYVSGTSSATVGDKVSASIVVNTSGQAANSFEATISWPSFLTPVSGSRGGVCSFYIDEPSSPSGSSGSLSCGKSNGFTGTGTLYTLTFQAASAGSGRFGLSGCTVLANDGNGTNITGGCSGQSVNISAAVAAPVATPPASSSGGGSPTSTTRTSTPKPNTPTQTPTPAESAHTPAPTTAPTAPPVQALPASSSSSAAPATTTSSAAPAAVAEQKRSIGKAFTDLFTSLKQIRLLPKDGTGAVALLLTLIPVLILALAIIFFAYRLYMLESKRRRSMNRLFELELSELSALEGKMDLLVEKGNKGRQQYVEEFEKTKQHILRQIRPDYGKPVEATPVP